MLEAKPEVLARVAFPECGWTLDSSCEADAVDSYELIEIFVEGVASKDEVREEGTAELVEVVVLRELCGAEARLVAFCIKGEVTGVIGMTLLYIEDVDPTG
jgi:hypothetical protein